jgi:hypothetical protein
MVWTVIERKRSMGTVPENLGGVINGLCHKKNSAINNMIHKI